MREVSESAMNAGGNVQFSFAAAAREIIMAGLGQSRVKGEVSRI